MPEEALRTDRKPQWTTREQDCWIDLFSLYQELTMGAVLEEGDNPMNPARAEQIEKELKDTIPLCADLADFAMSEMQARGFTREPRIASRRTRRR